MRTGRAVVATVLVAVAAACNDAGLVGLHEFSSEGSVWTDSTSYHVTTSLAQHSVTIEVSFRNPTDGEVHIGYCHGAHPPVLEKLEARGWVAVYSPMVLACAGPTVRVAPGTEYSMRYDIVAARLPNTYPRFEMNRIPGTYRLNWHALHTESGDALPEAHRTSNSFRLRSD